MFLRFFRFRQILSSTLAISSGTSMILGIYLSKFFIRQGVVWLLVGVELFSLLRSTWSAVRKPMFNVSQSVASEGVGLFVLFPFQLIILLLLFAVLPRQGHHALAFLVLRISAISSAIIHILYTIGLAVLTVPSFDADVWLRDIDSSPSPFPLAIIFAFACPCLARRFGASRAFVHQSDSQETSPNTCLPTCLPNCTLHGNAPRMNYKPPSSVENGTQIQEVENSEGINKVQKRTPPVLPHTLIRIPNAAERRASIYVDLQLGPQY